MPTLIASQKVIELSRAEDPKRALIEAVEVSKFRTFGENLTVATYIRPEKTRGGIIRPSENIKEDELQGNIGLVVKVGEGFTEEEAKEMLHQWVRFGYNDGLKWRYNEVPLRDISIDRIRGTVENPSEVL